MVNKGVNMNKYKGTQTEKNLEAAFAGESQARNKYTYFASAAKKEGYEQIAAIFTKTADNENKPLKMSDKFQTKSTFSTEPTITKAITNRA